MQDFTAGQKLIWSKLKKRMDKRKTYYVSINSSTNNTIATITDRFGNTLAWTSCGSLEFPGRQKATEVANEAAGSVMFEMLQLLGIINLGIILKGVKRWQKSFVKSMLGKVKEEDEEGGEKETKKKAGPSVLEKNKGNFKIVLVKNVSTVPHNGCSRWKSCLKKKTRRLKEKREAKDL